jgi:hypothetical protein
MFYLDSCFHCKLVTILFSTSYTIQGIFMLCFVCVMTTIVIGIDIKTHDKCFGPLTLIEFLTNLMSNDIYKVTY